MLNFKEVPFDLKLFSDRNKPLSVRSFVTVFDPSRSASVLCHNHLVRVSGVTRAYRTSAASPGAPGRPGTDEDVRTWAGLEAVAKKAYY